MKHTHTPQCEFCGDTGKMYAHAKCHPTAPLKVSIEDGILEMRCYVPECDRLVARLRVADFEPARSTDEAESG